KHIDPIGTLVVPGVLLMLGGFIFGWAKPVPVTWENLRQPRRDMALVALAGPLANLAMAVVWLLVLNAGILLEEGSPSIARPLIYMAVAGIFINAILMLINLLPILPLDGGRIVSSMLPGPLSWQYSRLEPYGLIILLVLFFTQMLGKILWPVLIGFFAALFMFSNTAMGYFNTVLRMIV